MGIYDRDYMRTPLRRWQSPARPSLVHGGEPNGAHWLRWLALPFHPFALVAISLVVTALVQFKFFMSDVSAQAMVTGSSNPESNLRLLGAWITSPNTMLEALDLIAKDRANAVRWVTENLVLTAPEVDARHWHVWLSHLFFQPTWTGLAVEGGMCVGAFLLLAAAMDEAVDGKLRLPGVVLGTLLAAGAYSVATIWTNTQPTWGLWPCWGFLLGMLICVGEYPFVPRLLCAGVAVAAASGWVNPLATMSIQTTPFAAVCATGCLVSLWAQFRDRVLLW